MRLHLTCRHPWDAHARVLAPDVALALCPSCHGLYLSAATVPVLDRQGAEWTVTLPPVLVTA